MKKAIFSFAFLSLSLFAAPIKGQVSAVDQSTVRAAISGAKAGQSAVTVFTYEGGEAISRQCTVSEASGDSATLVCHPFIQLDQDSVPGLELPVRVGDTVIAGPLSKTALIIAPSAARYVRVQDRHKEYRLIHPDLFAAQLTKDDNPNPEAEDFKTFCDTWMVGTLIFALSDGDWTVDCQSFVALSFDADTPVQENELKPFFHRLDKIERGTFAWGTPKEIKSFDGHYRNLIQKEFHAGR